MTEQLYPDFGPVEDLMLGIFNRWFASVPTPVHVATQFEVGMPLPTVIARADQRSGIQAFGNKDDRFLRITVVQVSVITAGPNGDGIDADIEASQLAESAGLAIRQAHAEQWVIPGVGHLGYMEIASPFSRKTDFQTSTSVVQYASLPDGLVRYEGIYRILLRPPIGGSGNPFLPTT